MEEKELFEEIKPLIKNYKEYSSEAIPEVFSWNDSRASSIKKVDEVNYTRDREGEILEILNEEKNTSNRRELIEELEQIREAKKVQIRSTIFEKVEAFVNDEKEKMNSEIEEKRQSLETEKEEKRQRLEEKQKELRAKKRLRTKGNKRDNELKLRLSEIEGSKVLGKKDPVAYFIKDEMIKIVEENKNLSRDIDALTEECKTLKHEYESFDLENDERLQEALKRLSDFEEIYGNIDFESEEGINYIEELVEKLKERQEGEKSEERPEENTEYNGDITNEDTIRELEERKALQEEIMQMFVEVESGNEDLLHPAYIKLKEKLLEREDLEKVIKLFKGKTLLDIYEEQIAHLDENSLTRIQLEEIVEKLKERQEIQPEEIQPEGTKQKGTKQRGTKSKGTKPQETKPQEIQPQEIQPEESNENQISEHDVILNEIEQKFMEFEAGNEDLLLPIYYDYKEKYINDSVSDLEYAKKILEYCKRTNLSSFYKDILDAISQEEQPSEEEFKDITDIKNIMANLAERDNHRIKSTTIVVEPYKGLIKINIKGREKTIVLGKLLELIAKGKELQKGELISKFGVNRCNPAILEALIQISETYPVHKDLVDEYINTFNNGTDKIDDIIYYFNPEEDNKVGNYKEIVKAFKKYAKADEKYGKATIEGTYKEGILDKIKGFGTQITSFFKNLGQKRIESKAAKDYRTSRIKRFREKDADIEEPVNRKKPREAFMKKMRQRGNKPNEQMDMSEAIKKLESINRETGDQPVVKEEESVL